MRVDFKKVSNCCLCGSVNLQLVMQLPDSPVADHYVTAKGLQDKQLSYPLDLNLCLDCGQVQLAHVVNPDNIYKDYLYTTTTSVGLPDHFRQYASEVVREVKPAPNTLVVDIGSNDGTLLKCFQEHGMTVLGVDPAEPAARKARLAGVATITGYLNQDIVSEIRNSRGLAEIVTANNVIANVENLRPFIDCVRGLLSPSGIFVFETGYLLDIVKQHLFDTIYHEHLFYFSVRPLRQFFESVGLVLIHAEPILTKGGSLRGYVQHAGGLRKIRSSVSEMEAREEAYQLHSKGIFDLYQERIGALKRQLLDKLESLRRDGKTIAGYGASHSVTTLICTFDLGRALDFIVDDNPQKQNTFSPGFHIPVLSPDALLERNPDYVVILPWRFCDAIVSRNQAYLAGGGKFLVPIPELKEITL